MKLSFLIQEPVHALRSSLMRSLLTVVGIVVGIFSVTAMLALGEGLSANVLEKLSSFAQGDITITGDINFNDFMWINQQSYVKESIATKDITNVATVVYSSEFSPTVQAVVGDYESLQQYKVSDGEVFDWQDSTYDDHVVVVSNGFADTVLEETGRSVLGQMITLNGQKYEVIGVIESSAITFTRNDGMIWIPYATTIGLLTNSANFSSAAVKLEDSSYFEIAGKHIMESLNASRQLAKDSEDVFSVETAQGVIESAEETSGMISLFLGIVGGVALFVGGIGTMNMMLTTVTERTKEIGLRKAIGARDKDIMIQILLESVALTAFGGMVGIFLSIGGAKLANQVFADSSVISVIINLKVVLLAAIVSLAVGIVFGLYPARNASKLQPVDALRSE